MTKNNVKECLRWAAVGLTGGLGLAILLGGGYGVITNPQSDWLKLLFGLWLLAAFSSPFFIVAWIFYLRRYRELFNVLGVVAGVIVFGVLVSLPLRWHVVDFFIHHDEKPWMVMIGLPVSILCLVAPYYGAAWTIRFVQRLAQPPVIGANVGRSS